MKEYESSLASLLLKEDKLIQFLNDLQFDLYNKKIDIPLLEEKIINKEKELEKIKEQINGRMKWLNQNQLLKLR